MFDRNRTFTLKLLSGTDKKVSCRFPTDEELIARARKLVRVTRAGGATELKNFEQVELDFVEKIRAGQDSIELSGAEAIYIVDRLLRSQVSEVERVANQFRVTLKVAYGEVVHTLDVPTLDAARKYDKSVNKAAPKRNAVESYECLDGVAAFWKSCNSQTEGYVEGQEPPVVHMQTAIEEVIAQMNQAMEDVDPEM